MARKMPYFSRLGREKLITGGNDFNPKSNWQLELGNFALVLNVLQPAYRNL
jgi:hypothetical protein